MAAGAGPLGWARKKEIAMLPSHRARHRANWLALAILLPLILLAGALVRPEAIEKAPQRLDAKPAGK